MEDAGKRAGSCGWLVSPHGRPDAMWTWGLGVCCLSMSSQIVTASKGRDGSVYTHREECAHVHTRSTYSCVHRQPLVHTYMSDSVRLRVLERVREFLYDL